MKQTGREKALRVMKLVKNGMAVKTAIKVVGISGRAYYINKKLIAEDEFKLLRSIG